MSANNELKFALVSHVLPPSSSGQAMVLFRLLEGLSSADYCLISCEDYTSEEHDKLASSKLAAKYYALRPEFQVPVINFLKLSALSVISNIFLRLFSRARQIRNIIRQENCNLVIACTGNLYDLPAAYLASRWTGIPLIPYIFDDYIYQWTGFNRLIAKLMEPLIFKKAIGVIVPNEYMKEEYEKRYDIQSTVIHNPCLLPDLTELDKQEDIFNRNDINIVYTGAVYHAHYDALKNLIKALERLGRDEVKFHIFTAQSESMLKENGISGQMLVYHPHIKHAEVSNVLRQADILFLPLAFDSPIPEVIKTSSPGKAGEYLAVGRPILVHAPIDSFVSWYFRENDCGVVVDNNNPDVLLSAIVKIISDKPLQVKLGRKARAMAERDFSVDEMKSRFLDILTLHKD